MSFEWFVARRYLTARRKQAFISLISGVSILGVGVGVMALIVALALMTGVQSELRDRILGSTAHVYVSRLTEGGFKDVDAEIAKLMKPGVTGASPAITGLALVQASRSEIAPITLKGIDPEREPSVTGIVAALRTGSLAALTTRPDGALPGVILGQDLADSIHVAEGDDVEITTLETVMTPMGPKPTSRRLQVVGTVYFGFYQVDSGFAFVSLDTAMQLLRRTGPDMIQLRLKNMDDAPATARTLGTELGTEYDVNDWTKLNDALYAALRLEKIAISLTIGLIVLVAALNIVASLVLLVMEKSRDIAILRTMGAPAGAIRRIFILQGLTIGFIGTATGAILGIVVSRLCDRYQLIKLSAEVYQMPYLPFRLEPMDVAIVVVSAIAVCFLATVYPSRQAGRLDPAEALRHQ